MRWWEARAATIRRALRVTGRRPRLVDVGRGLLGVVAATTVTLALGTPGAAASAAGGAAVAGAMGLRGGPRGRLPSIVAVSVVMGAATFAGALAAPHTVLFVGLAVVWSFAIGMLWAVGSAAGVVAAAGSVLLVAAASVPLSVEHMLGRAALVTAGGLVQAVLVVVWPGRRWRVQREALAGAYRAVADGARALAADPRAVLDPAPPATSRAAFTLTERQAGRRPPAFRDYYGLPERIRPALTAVARATESGTAAERDAAQAWLRTAGEVLDGVAAGRPATDPRAAEQLRELIAETGRTTCPLPAARPLAEQLTRAVDLAGTGALPVGESAERLRRPGPAASLRSAAGAVGAQLSPASPVFRHALRLAGTTGAAVVLARATGLQHGYWIALTTLMVMRPETARTVERCLARVAGNAVGITLPAVVTVALHPGAAADAVLALAFLGCAYLLSETGYVALTASLATAIVFLTAATGADEPDAVATRLLATAIGGALAVTAHLLLPAPAPAGAPHRRRSHANGEARRTSRNGDGPTAM
ncbi:FUSC family protein [Kitasatospora sp. NPDC048365]|uniref:FUSC family protein n=1 Tax=Kitasatospora sp. NPDC048365 TaxID=3364050 RepID=UPI003720B637